MQVVHCAPAPSPICVEEVRFDGPRAEWVEILCYREIQHEEYAYTARIWRDKLEEWCWERFEFEPARVDEAEPTFIDWWHMLSNAERMEISVQFLESENIGPSLDAHYAAWLTKQAIS